MEKKNFGPFSGSGIFKSENDDNESDEPVPKKILKIDQQKFKLSYILFDHI